MDKDTVCVCHTHTMGYYSATQQWDHAICSNMDGPRDYPAKWSKPDREK